MAEKGREHGGSHISGKKASQGGRGSATEASPAAIQRFLKGVSYPCDKKNLVKHAKQNNAPEDVMYVLNQLEDRDYNSPVDVEREVGKIE